MMISFNNNIDINVFVLQKDILPRRRKNRSLQSLHFQCTEYTQKTSATLRPYSRIQRVLI